MTQLKMLSADDKLTEIRRIYFETSRQTIQQDLEKALHLLKSMTTEEERERAAVYMEGLAEMRSDWLKVPRATRGDRPKAKKPASGRGRDKAPAKKR